MIGNCHLTMFGNIFGLQLRFLIPDIGHLQTFLQVASVSFFTVDGSFTSCITILLMPRQKTKNWGKV